MVPSRRSVHELHLLESLALHLVCHSLESHASMEDVVADRFVDWFKQHNGSQHESVALTHFEGMGRGAVALHDIAADTVLFSIPRNLLLNTTNSSILARLSTNERESLRGWTPLILAMMWESLQGDGGLWQPYFDIMPREFDSLMFWNEHELHELKGSSILDKIGKEQAMLDYRELVVPLIRARSDLFHPAEAYSEDLYNRMGSLILSRSFHVEDYQEDEEDANGDTSMASTSSAGLNGAVHGTNAVDVNEHDDDDDDEEEEDDMEDVKHVAMVPWADMLNARHGCDNARLFYERDCLNMCATRLIEKGEQIWNVYGDPPNSDLLRRYGHVDLDNPSDIVDVPADLVANVTCKCSERQKVERIDFLIEADLDDMYTFTSADYEEELENMLAAIAVFSADDAAFSKMQKKGKVSRKGLVDNKEFIQAAMSIFQTRLAQYPHNFQDDEQAIRERLAGLPERRRNALIVRHGEMRILYKLVSDMQAKLPSALVAAEPASEDPRAEGARGGSSGKILSRKEQREEKKRQREEDSLLRGNYKKRSSKT